MKIKETKVNNHKKVIVAETSKRSLELPFSRLALRPTRQNKISDIYVDPDLGYEGVTYVLESGEEDTVHLDVFLDYNRDPDFLRTLFLYELTVAAQDTMEKTELSKNEICRRLQTSPSQLARLLDQTNHRKTVDKMLELLAVLGVSVKPSFAA